MKSKKLTKEAESLVLKLRQKLSEIINMRKELEGFHIIVNERKVLRILSKATQRYARRYWA